MNTRNVVLSILLCFFVFITSCTQFLEQKPQQPASIQPLESPAQTLTVANWNLQIFGQSKANKPELMNFYASVMDDYDIIFIQEIRDASQTAFPKLCALLPDYQCIVSSRAGRTSSKEQYGIIYKNGITAQLQDFNPDAQNRWERPPIKVSFTSGNYTFSVYNIHTDPDDVKNEIRHLQDIVVNQGNVIIMGDLNADCNYYNPVRETEFDPWLWAIADSLDTTVSGTDCTYDRIILNDEAKEEFLQAGVYKDGIDSIVSDHYLVWMKISASEVGN